MASVSDALPAGGQHFAGQPSDARPAGPQTTPGQTTAGHTAANQTATGRGRAARMSPQISASTFVQALPPAKRYILRGGPQVMTAAGNALGLIISKTACRAATNSPPAAAHPLPASGLASAASGSGSAASDSGSTASGSAATASDSAPATHCSSLASPAHALSALWLGPDEQLLLGSDGADPAAALHEALRDLPHSLVEVSHRQIALRVSGPHATALLNAGCPLDLDLSAFPVGMCTRTVLAKAEIVLWRTAQQVFHIEVWRSFAPYVSGLLAEVARELVP